MFKDLEISQLFQCLNGSKIIIREAGGNRRTEAENRIRERYEHATLLALNMEEVANEGLWPLEARKEKGNFLLEPPEEMQLCQFPDFRTSDPQTRKEINLENFKPLSL